MKREELDTLWFQAMRQSIEEGEDFIRYHFAALVAAAEREACAKVCEEHVFIAIAIRARGEVPR